MKKLIIIVLVLFSFSVQAQTKEKLFEVIVMQEKIIFQLQLKDTINKKIIKYLQTSLFVEEIKHKQNVLHNKTNKNHYRTTSFALRPKD